MSKKDNTVMGHHLPSPKPTIWAAIMFLWHIALPILGILLIIDIALYGIFTHLFERCYGIMCFFE